MMVASPPSITATTELVVPRSIPMTFPAMDAPFASAGARTRPTDRGPDCAGFAGRPRRLLANVHEPAGFRWLASDAARPGAAPTSAPRVARRLSPTGGGRILHM